MSLLESTVQQLDETGCLGPMKDICTVRAEKTFLSRFKQDTNPSIVQMVFEGGPIGHWYYRSLEWIDQPYFFPAVYLQPYVGPADRAHPWLYGEETYVIDEERTHIVRNKAEK